MTTGHPPLPNAYGFTAFQATFRRWDREASKAAVTLRHGETLHSLSLRWSNTGHEAQEITRTVRVWAQGSDRARVEQEEGGVLTRLQVRDGDRWLVWSDVDGEVRGTGYGGPSTAMLMEPRQVLDALDVIGYSKGRRAGRPTYDVTARARSLAMGGQTYRLEFDTEFGTLLRSAVNRSGAITSVSEALAVAYNHGIDAKAFALDARPVSLLARRS